MSNVVVIGSFNVDHVWRCEALPVRGQTLAGLYSTGPGGKGFNQAIAAARSGAMATFLCSLGSDDGARLARGLASEASLQLIAHDAHAPTGTAGIWVDHSGHNSIVIGPGANAELSPAFVSMHASHLENARVVLVQLESPMESVLEALRIAKHAGAATILNPAPAAALPESCLIHVDILTPNETELQTIAHEPGIGHAMPDESLHGICRRVLPHGTVVLTLGEQGCFVSHGADARGDDHAFYRVPAMQAQALDTTGAGDAFNGALAATYQHACAFRDRIAWASAYAALSTEREGASLSMPRASDVSRRFGLAFAA